MQYNYETFFSADQYNPGYEYMMDAPYCEQYATVVPTQMDHCYAQPVSTFSADGISWESLSDWSSESSSLYDSGETSFDSPLDRSPVEESLPVMLPERCATPVAALKEIPRVRLTSLPESSESLEGNQRLSGERAPTANVSIPRERNSLPSSPKSKKRARAQSSRSQSMESYEDTEAPKRKRRPSPRILRRMMEATVKQEDTHMPMFIAEPMLMPSVAVSQHHYHHHGGDYLRTGSEMSEIFSHVHHPQPQRMMHRQEEWVYEEIPTGVEYRMAQ